MQIKQLKKFLQENNIDYLENESFKKYCTYGVGGKIKIIIFPFNINELLKLLNFLENSKYFILGNGSKLLPSDKAFKIPVIKLNGEFEGFETKKLDSKTFIIKAYAGTTVAKLLNYSKVNGYSGLEFLCGIPASVGGIVYMNAAAYLGETKNVVESVNALVFENSEWKYRTFKAEECNFNYRKSIFQTIKAVIISVNFKVEKLEATQVIENCKHALELRKHHAVGKSCGSVFKKAGKDCESAGKLIDECGLKGLQYKNAKISEQHANFIINLGEAKSKHIKKLINKAHLAVQKKYGIDLEREVIYLEE